MWAGAKFCFLQEESGRVESEDVSSGWVEEVFLQEKREVTEEELEWILLRLIRIDSEMWKWVRFQILRSLCFLL
jgi:hypothetical protein